MSWPRATRIVLFVMVIATLLFDLAAAAFGGANGTISLQVWKMSGADWRAATFVFTLGYLAGHVLGRIDK